MQKSDFQYRVSVIVPIYNVEQFLRTALDSLATQSISPDEMEILMVDDGSPDNSIDIMREYAEAYPNFKILRKENGGLSSARNFGIRHAKGKYLMYLDADDWYSPETVKSVADFFDEHYDEIDLVDIKIIPIRDGKQGRLHYRYRILEETNVYDLAEQPNWYITQTTVNICVKNLGSDNILFDETPGFRHEDQKYCTQVLQRNLKIGFCDNAIYFYRQQSASITHTVFQAYYLFETTTEFWENLFSEYAGGDIPPYIQALYLNDINWKTSSDILLPYHYTREEFQKATERLLALLNKVEDPVILNHPDIGLYRRHFFLSLKTGRQITLSRNKDSFSVSDGSFELFTFKNIEINIRRFKRRNDTLELTFVLKSPVFDYISTQPRLLLELNGNSSERIELTLHKSSWDYSGAKVKTASSWLVDANINMASVCSFCFYAIIGQLEIPCDVNIDWRLNFYRSSGKPYEAFFGNCNVSCYQGIFRVRPIKLKDRVNQRKWFLRSHTKEWLKRQYYISRLGKMSPCWLYYDCKGYGQNNGYFQFNHDFAMADGISRYYIINEDNFESLKALFPESQRPFLVRFGSEKHKLLYLNASMILTAFIEDNNYIPFNRGETDFYADLCRQHDLVYLQHGVLHAHLPWKYSRDRINVDYEVISTRFEAQNLVQNYCFTPDSLLKCGMPRYDTIDSAHSPQRRILFAPSWRKYLVAYENGNWVNLSEKFLSSIFFKETQKFLSSPVLHSLLEQYGYELDYKMHPIFTPYESLYSIDSPRVHLGKTLDDADYCCYISDFSSYTFDFVYLKRPIFYFFPDYELFRAGMCEYRELDLPLENGFGPLVETADAMIAELKQLLENNCIPSAEYTKRENDFFLYYDNHCRSRIYRALTKID